MAESALTIEKSVSPDRMLDAVVIGAGFAGLYMAYTLRELGLSFKGFEAGSGVGGTWFWNRYPGARCDAESVAYSYSFSEELDQEWTWTERFAAQPEILRYIEHVADRFDLEEHFSFNTTVTHLTFDEQDNYWVVATEDGNVFRARFVITAVGCLSVGRVPDIPGLETFKGRTFHTGNWPHEPVSFDRRRVAMIGTGSSGIQLLPQVARDAAHVSVFQRTPNFSVPANNGPLEPAVMAEVKKNYPVLRERSRKGLLMAGGASLLSPEDSKPAAARAADLTPDEQQAALQKRWDIGGAFVTTTFPDMLTDEAANAIGANFVRSKIRAIVEDQDVAERLCPTDYPFASKRICVDTDYFQTYNRSNVELVDIRKDAIASITEGGLLLESGAEYLCDDLIFATGFDAMTGALLRMDVTGRDGRTLAEHWRDGPRTYLGIGLSGFPNLFTITGPLSPTVLSNVVVSIEQHVEWIRDCLSFMNENKFSLIESDSEHEDNWVNHVREIADNTLFKNSNSWYNGSNIPGKPRVFMIYLAGVGPYREICDEIAADGFRGFTFE